jgi:hypothetical protein
MRRNAYFNVRPRYTAGSPGIVPEALACRIAAEEKETYGCYIRGIYGEDEKARAQSVGLGYIVELVGETSKGWEVTDIITKESYLRAFIYKKNDRVDYFDDQKGWICGLTVVETARRDDPDVKITLGSPYPWTVQPVQKSRLRVPASVKVET